MDIICFNRYNGWYQNPGRLDMKTEQVIDEASGWHARYNKPIIMTEYGADTISGLHMVKYITARYACMCCKNYLLSFFQQLPEYVWSEEYQQKLLSMHFRAFDKLREKGFFIGEFLWNFADFKTAQSIHI